MFLLNYIVLFDLVEFGARDLNIMLLSICEFCENWHREGQTFLARLN